MRLVPKTGLDLHNNVCDIKHLIQYMKENKYIDDFDIRSVSICSSNSEKSVHSIGSLMTNVESSLNRSTIKNQYSTIINRRFMDLRIIFEKLEKSQQFQLFFLYPLHDFEDRNYMYFDLRLGDEKEASAHREFVLLARKCMMRFRNGRVYEHQSYDNFKTRFSRFLKISEIPIISNMRVWKIMKVWSNTWRTTLENSVRKQIKSEEILINIHFQSFFESFQRWRRNFHHESILRVHDWFPQDFDEFISACQKRIETYMQMLPGKLDDMCTLLVSRHRNRCWFHGRVTRDFCDCNLYHNYSNATRETNERASRIEERRREMINAKIEHFRSVAAYEPSEKCVMESCIEALKRLGKRDEDENRPTADQIASQSLDNLLEKCVKLMENMLTDSFIVLARNTMSDILTQVFNRYSADRFGIHCFFAGRTYELLQECTKLDKSHDSNFALSRAAESNVQHPSSVRSSILPDASLEPLIIVHVDIVNGKIDWKPKKAMFLSSITALLRSLHKSITSVESIAYSQRFKYLFRQALTPTGALNTGRKKILPMDTLNSDLEYNSLLLHVIKLSKDAYRQLENQVKLLILFVGFYQLYNKLDKKLLKKYDKDVDWWSDRIRNSLLQKVVFSEMKDAIDFGFFFIDTTEFKKKLLSANARYHEHLGEYLATLSIASCNKLNTSIQQTLSKLEFPVSKAKHYVDLLTAHERFLETVETIQDACDNAERMHDIVSSYKLHDFTESEKKSADMMERNLARCLTASDSCAANKQELYKTANKLVAEDARRLNEQVRALGLKLHKLHLLDSVVNDEQANQKIIEIDEILTALIERANVINDQQKALRVNASKFVQLDEFGDEFNAMKLLFEARIELNQCVEEIWGVPLFEISIHSVVNMLSEIQRKLAIAERKLQPNTFATELRKEFEHASSKMPLITCFVNPNMKHHHLVNIYNRIGYNQSKGTQLTVEILEDLNAFSHTDYVVEIGNAANFEASIEELLLKIQSTWEQMMLPVINKPVNIIPAVVGDFEQVYQILEDSIVNISAIVSSKYIGRYKFKASMWQNDLMELREAMDDLSALQRDYIFLEKIFTSSDIKKQLSKEVWHFTLAENILLDVMRLLVRSPKALELVHVRGLKNKLSTGVNSVEIIKAGLAGFLSTKRRNFPRFYFLSDQELLEIQSNADNPIFMQDYIRKCFDGIQSLNFQKYRSGLSYVTAVNSPEGELFEINKVKVSQVVEQWLVSLENSMKDTVKKFNVNAVKLSENLEFRKWMEKHCHQAIINACYVNWTKCVTDILLGQSKLTLKDYENLITSRLREMAAMARENIPTITRLILKTLITINVHARDIVGHLAHQSVTDINDFEWSRQLRYYLVDGKLDVKIANASFTYANEYLGCAERLVITPLTDRCYLCLTGAIQVHLGGAPAGPAGTGKTETTKDLAKALGKACVIFNCSESTDYKLMARYFSGMAQAGIWCCFDEFNRIDIEVLSVVAQQLMTIRDAKRSMLSTMNFNEEEEMPLNAGCAAFITMNPGYAGRTELPDNLKMLFRPIAMMVPDYTSIVEVILYSEGFERSSLLAGKIVLMYKICSEQLSKQDHYDFGMRAIKSLLIMAGQMKRSCPNEVEDIVLIRALYESNIPKFLSSDAELFKNITGDLFPTVTAVPKTCVLLEEALKETMNSRKMICAPQFMAKVSQLHSTLQVRHGVMIVGCTGSGKSTICDSLSDACTLLSQGEENGFNRIKIHHLNPKAITIDELYGCYDKHTLEWKEGLLGKIVKRCISVKESVSNWIVFDGPVDALWIENLNTVLDDNKMLCLPNSDRIKLPENMRMIFEVVDLHCASPATVSRCGMVYTDEQVTGWRPFVENLLTNLSPKIGEEFTQLLRDFFQLYLEAGLDMVTLSNHESQAQSRLGKVSTLCAMIDSLLSQRSMAKSSRTDKSFLCNAFVFCYFWALVGNGTVVDWEEFDIFAKQQFDRSAHIQVPPSLPLFKCYVNYKSGILEQWDDIVTQFTYNQQLSVVETFVPNTDTARFSYMVKILLSNNYHVLLTGDTGVGKSVILKQSCNDITESNDIGCILMNFSARTDSKSFQQALMSKIARERRSLRMNATDSQNSNLVVDINPTEESEASLNVSPRESRRTSGIGKRTIVAVDDLNMPKPDEFGTQSTIELMRQCIDRGGIYLRGNFNWMPLKELTFGGTCGPPGGGRTLLCPRLLRTMAVFNIPQQEEFEMKTLFRIIVKAVFAESSMQFLENISIIIDVAVEFYLKVVTIFRPTPIKSHYVFNMRDLSRTIQGMCLISKDEVWTLDSLTEVLLHEVSRVFHDRLLNSQEVSEFYNQFENTFYEIARRNIDVEKIIGGRLMFGDFGKLDTGKLSKYEKMNDFDKLKKKLTIQQDTFLQKNRSSPRLIFFEKAITHLLRILRILMQNRGNALLLGMSGVGKKSLVRLGCFMYGIECFEIKQSRGYSIDNFREELKQLYRRTGTENDHCVLLLSDDQMLNEDILDDINGFLNNGEVSNLWERSGELEQLLVPSNKNAHEAQKAEKNYESMYEEFMLKVRRNLHIVICMSHLSHKFRSWCRMFPSIVTCTTVNFVDEWDIGALVEVANVLIDEDNELRTHEILKEKLKELAVEFHTTVEKCGVEMSLKEQRSYFATSSTYIHFLKTFMKRKNRRRVELRTDQQRYIDGIQKLMNTNDLVKEMNVILSQLEPQLKAKHIKSNETEKEIKNEQQKATTFAEMVSMAKDDAERKAEEVGLTRDDADKELAALKPILDKAARALDSLNKEDIQMVGSYAHPPKKIQFLMEAICLICEVDTSWESARNLLNRNRFIDQLKDIGENIDKKPASLFRQLKTYLEHQDFRPEVLGRSSSACKSLCEWVIALNEYRRIYIKVAPVQQKYNYLQAEYNNATEVLARKQNELLLLSNKIKALKEKAGTTEREKIKLNSEIEKTKAKISRSEKMTVALLEEGVRWGHRRDELQVLLDNNIVDTFFSSAYLCYQGPFSDEYRQKIFESWLELYGSKELNAPKNVLESLIPDFGVVVEWQQKGLPTDAFSTSSAIITKQNDRWPICIDPQGQAIEWLRRSIPEHRQISHKDHNLLKVAELSIKLGSVLFIVDVDGSIDSGIIRIVEKNFFEKNGRLFVLVGDTEVQYNANFQLFMITNKNAPDFTPEHFSKCNVVNFEVTLPGLIDQLLGETIRTEKPEVEIQRSKLILKKEYMRQQLAKAESEILDLINRSGSSILDDDSVLNILQDSKAKATESKAGVLKLEELGKEFENIRSQYQSLAEVAAVIYFAIDSLQLLNPMYSWSLEYFIRIFHNVIVSNSAQKIVQDRLQILSQEFCLKIFETTSWSLFEKDRRLLAFIICVQLKRLRGNLNEDLMYAFLSDKSLEVEELECPKNIVPSEWQIVMRLSHFSGFEELPATISSIVSSSSSTSPISLLLTSGALAPRAYFDSLSALHQMILAKHFRPHLLRQYTVAFIEAEIGSRFTYTNQGDLKNIYEHSSYKVPILFILCPGSDPMDSFRSLCASRENTHNYKFISLGQGQGPKAETLIRHGLSDGTWIFLQNCHLAPSWMNNLEMIFNEMMLSDRINENFRLFLSTMPTRIFPKNVLSNSIKVTVEPPRGIRDNALKCIGMTNEDYFSSSQIIDVALWRKAITALSFFHSTVLDRKKFGSRGWNIPYEFNDSDYDYALNCLKHFVQNGKLIWSPLHYIIGEITYGGRVTDLWDQRCLRATLQRIFTPKISDELYKFSESGIYHVSNCDTYENTKTYLTSLPLVTSCDMFGLNPVINDLVQEKEAIGFMQSVRNILAFDSKMETSRSVDNNVIDLCEWIARVLPMEVLNIDAAPSWMFLKDAQDRFNSLTSFLIHEVQRYNALLTFVKASSLNLKNAVIGTVVMDEEAEANYKSFNENKLPELWKKICYPTARSLRNFILDLNDRLRFMEAWIQQGHPRTVWISGLYFPQGFLTAILQIYARKKSVPIDELKFAFHFTNVFLNQREYTESILSSIDEDNEYNEMLSTVENGIFIHGLYADCFTINTVTKMMEDPVCSKLISDVPVIHLEPIHIQIALDNVFPCPLYRTPERSGILSTTGHSTNYVTTIALKTDKPIDFWTERACAMLCESGIE